MALAIATNTGALTAAAAATSVNKDMETSMARLSTGKRINSAADDAAGVAIASRLSSEIRGTNQAIRNAMDAQGMLNTAEGAHKEIENILQRMRELAVQAANDTNDGTDRSNLQAEMDQLTEEINRISEVTTWAGQTLLNGAGGTDGNGAFKFQLGARTGDADSISVSINAVSAAALGVGEGNIAVAANASTLDEVGNNVVKVGGSPAAGDVFSLDVAGTSVSYTVITGDIGADAEATRTNVATKIAAAVNAGATANFKGLTATAATDGTVTLNQSVTFSDMAITMGGSALSFDDGDYTISDNVLTIVDASGVAADDAVTFELNGEEISVTVADTDAYGETIDGLVAQLNDAFANETALNGVTLVAAKSGSSITITATPLTTTLIENAEANPAAQTEALSLASADDAQSAIELIDAAISTVNTQRANLGAVSNRLDNTVSNLTNVVINLEGGKGRIEDADFAAESTNLSKSQILQQASTAMLAQANASKQNVLSLLQG